MELRRPVRVSHGFVQSLVAPPSLVFPLLCPVREREWVPGWEPDLVISSSGVVEADCVFTTPVEATREPRAGSNQAIWYVLRHDPEELLLEMLKVTPGLVATRVRIELEEADGRMRDEATAREVLCLAHVRYTHTALSAAGEAEVESWNPARWRSFMEQWQSELNAFLARRPDSEPEATQTE